MRRILFAFILTALVSLPAGAHAQARGQVQDLEVAAPSLAGNLVGTADVQRVAVYLPPSYRRANARRYPVVYLLHGIFDGRQVWLDHVGLPARLDRMIAERGIPEAIVVMPDGLNRYGGGFYRNSPVSGGWGDFIADDLMHYIDAHYRTLARDGGRAVVGWSMGGYGAIHLAMERPGLYSVVYGISPCCLAPVEDLGFGNDAWQRAYHFDEVADIDAALEGGDYYSVAAIGVMSAFSPEPNAPPFFVDFPMNFENGQFVPDGPAYDRYVSLFPLARAAQTREAMLGLRVFAFDYGVNDQFAHIPVATREFSNRLSELRIPHRLDVYDGDHRILVPDRLETIVLPYVINALDRPEGR